VIVRVALALALASSACHHDAPAPKTASDEVPPLPPSSGTPIGYLVDASGQLHLTDDQLGKLRDIDTGLAAELEQLDAQSRSANKPQNPDASQAPMRGGRHGGMRMGGGGMGRGRHGGGSGSGSGSGSASPAVQASIARIEDQKRADVKDAIGRALALLDDRQRAAAIKLLSDHDVDVDDIPAPPPPAAMQAETSEPPPVLPPPPPAIPPPRALGSGSAAPVEPQP